MSAAKDARVMLAIITGAAERLDADLKAALPRSVYLLGTHFELAASPSRLVEALLGPRSFPSLLVPFWMAPRASLQDDRQFLSDVTYSTLSGFLFIRLIDNVMDGDCYEGQRKVLPALGFFHTRFVFPYFRHFAENHYFWSFFNQGWDEHTDATTSDAFCDVIGIDTFMSVAARKFSATKVPAAATALRYLGREMLEPWARFIDRLGAFCQMINDFFDWHHDNAFQIRTYLQSEWLRRRNADESLTGWFLREGFDWGGTLLREWAADLETHAITLDNPHALQWVIDRKNVLYHDLDSLERGLRPVRAVYDAWRMLEKHPITHPR